MRDNFAVFILTHGRADNVKTYRSLRNCGYTGQIYLLVDNEDKHQSDYKSRYGDEVIIFDKSKAAEITDAGDNFKKRNSVLYARNWNFVIAKELGLEYFWQLDDDYSAFGWSIDNHGNYQSSDAATKKLDDILLSIMEFMDDAPIDCVAMAQGGDFIGGGEGKNIDKARNNQFLRKVMNSFLFKTDKPTKFVGRMNDDVNTYVTGGNRGKLYLTVLRLRLWQAETQSQEGGLTDMYLEAGTYVKSFYTVMYAPSCTEITEMGTSHKRLHHRIKWRYAVPKIVDEKYRKASHAS